MLLLLLCQWLCVPPEVCACLVVSALLSAASIRVCEEPPGSWCTGSAWPRACCGWVEGVFVCARASPLPTQTHKHFIGQDTIWTSSQLWVSAALLTRSTGVISEWRADCVCFSLTWPAKVSLPFRWSSVRLSCVKSVNERRSCSSTRLFQGTNTWPEEGQHYHDSSSTSSFSSSLTIKLSLRNTTNGWWRKLSGCSRRKLLSVSHSFEDAGWLRLHRHVVFGSSCS